MMTTNREEANRVRKRDLGERGNYFRSAALSRLRKWEEDNAISHFRNVGGSGNNILIGSNGADRIVGNGGDDLLFAGRTSYDVNNDQALMALLAAWNAGGNISSRVAAVQDTSKASYLTSDGTSSAPQTLFSDYAVDQLSGSAGTDLFFANVTADAGLKDIITDLKSEYAVDIDAL